MKKDNLKKSSKTEELFEFDKKFGCKVGGCDEAGRGPLAGPLVCAACVMPLDFMIEGINDSKKLSETKREALFEEIISKAISYHIEVVDCHTIDKINILNSTKQGMIAAINGLLDVDLVLVDALRPDCKFPLLPIIKGDAKSYNIAAASILAKVTRDRIMYKIHADFPKYEFNKHKGYGTALHIELLKKNGACIHHRRTFIKNFFDDLLDKSDKKEGV